MADGHSGATASRWQWTELFRTFQIALDPWKMLLAAGGIVATAFGWWLCSAAFFAMKSEPLQANYNVDAYQKADASLTKEAAQKKAEDAFQTDLERYKFFYMLSGSGDADSPTDWKTRTGYFRVMPWHQDRGPNPYLLATGQYYEGSRHGSIYQPGHFWEWLATKETKVLVEPLVKLLKPVVLLLNPKCDVGTRLYLLCLAIVSMAVWAFFGGAITRIAVLQLAGKDSPGVGEAVRFVIARYAHYAAAPIVPLVFVAGIILISILFGLVHLIPFVGDLWDGILWPIPLLLGFAQALLLVGLVGYPLMYATISAEGSDTFDALSRSYNYVYQAPWAYLWNAVVAVVYGMAVVFFISFMGSLVVYLTKWSIAQTPGTEYFSSRRVDHLFLYAPTSYDWRDLLVDRPELKSSANDAIRNAYLKDNVSGVNYISAFLVSIWTTLVLLCVVGFSYSYFFTSSSMIYLLMRQQVDDTEIDEVYSDDDFPEEPPMPPSQPAAPAGPVVQMVDAPTLRVNPTPVEKPA